LLKGLSRDTKCSYHIKTVNRVELRTRIVREWRRKADVFAWPGFVAIDVYTLGGDIEEFYVDYSSAEPLNLL
jgi:hypothetical protein